MALSILTEARPLTIFLLVVGPAVLAMTVHWSFAAVGWVFYLLWIIAIRITLAKNQGKSLGAAFRSIAIFAVLYGPVVCLIGLIVGEAQASQLIEGYKPIFLVLQALALGFVVYCAWTAARSLVLAEPIHVAVRWERTLPAFLLIYFFPVGIWLIQKRVQNVL